MQRRLGVLAIALSLLGCSAQASVNARAGSGESGAQTAGAETLKPRESNWDKESREEALIAGHSAEPMHETGAVEATHDGAAGDSAPGSATKARRSKKSAHNRGKAKKDNGGTEIATAADEGSGKRKKK